MPERQQHAMQSAVVVTQGLGDFAVNVVLERIDDPVGQLRLLALGVAAVYVCSNAALCFVAREEQHQQQPRGLADGPLKRRTWSARVRQMPVAAVRFLRSSPAWLWRVGAGVSLGFFAFFCIMPNSSAWLGSSVLQGAFVLLVDSLWGDKG